MKDASKVSMLKLRVWNVVLENLIPGTLTLRQVTRIDKAFPNLFSPATVPAGLYDITYKITVLTEQEAANKAVVQRFYTEVVDQKNLDALKYLFDPHFAPHDLDFGAHGGDLPGVLTGLPDVKTTITLWVSKDDLVTAVVTFSGTHKGTLLGIAPTGKPVTFSLIDIWRVKDGKLVELWHNVPNSDILAQISPPKK